MEARFCAQIDCCTPCCTFTVLLHCYRSAIDGAAKEDAHGGLYDSEDDLLESSEEEEDDDDGLEQKTQRMPEPRGGGSVRPKGTPTPPSGKRSSSLCDTPVRNSGPSDVRSGGKSHIRTKAGVRPTVAFQMQEMEGRPSEDDLNDSSADSGAKKQSVAVSGEGGTGGTTDFMREYMVSVSAWQIVLFRAGDRCDEGYLYASVIFLLAWHLFCTTRAIEKPPKAFRVSPVVFLRVFCLAHSRVVDRYHDNFYA